LSKTIKQLADELGVSKTAIRKRFSDEFKAHYVETSDDGSLLVTDDGCKLIVESLRKPVQTPQTSVVETTANPSLRFAPDTQQDTMGLLTSQLAAKDEQIRAQQQQLITKDEQIKMMQAQLSAKDDQIRSLTEQTTMLTNALASAQEAQTRLTESLAAEQALHAGTIQKQLTMQQPEDEKPHGLFGRLFGRKKKARGKQESE